LVADRWLSGGAGDGAGGLVVAFPVYVCASV